MKVIGWARSAAIVAGLCVFGAGQHAMAACIDFQGNELCEIGAARLTATKDSFRVDGLRRNGRDGVASNFEAATRWGSDVAVLSGNPGEFIRFVAVADGAPASNLNVTRVSNGLLMSTAFTGAAGQSNFSVVVLDHGVVTGVFDGGQGQDIYAQVVAGPDDGPWPNPYPFPFPFPWPPEIPDDPWPPIVFGIEAATGGCFWNLGLGNTVSVTVGSQQATGNEIRFVESVGPGHYPYDSFNSVRVTSNGSGLGGGPLEVSNGL